MTDPLTKDSGFTWDHCRRPNNCKYPTCDCNLSVEPQTSNPLLDLKLVQLFEDLVRGWGEPRWPPETVCLSETLGITCGDIYAFVDAISALRGAEGKSDASS